VRTFQQSYPRLTIASPQGHSGKTIVSIGLCAALRRRGLIVQPFKRGPDYIDPSWLTAASGRACRNLDTILMPDESVKASFLKAASDADVSVIEGTMGLFDGFNDTGSGSTAYIARLLKSPVILVVNASRMTRSIAALVTGFQHFEPDTNICAVILNNVANKRHELKLIDAVEHYCNIPVVGSIPKNPVLTISERHLGLVPYPEIEKTQGIEDISQILESNVNIEEVLKIAKSSAKLDVSEQAIEEISPNGIKIGIILDRVFHFYYPENLEALRQTGAELVYIDSLKDQILPEIDALIIGGGFPELFLEQLEANILLKENIAKAIEDYLPVYAECGGLMYLCRSIKWKSSEFKMVGAIPASVEIMSKPQAHGYINVEVKTENPLFPVGLKFWGHEFHQSHLIDAFNLGYAYQVIHGCGIDKKADGIIYKNLFASYLHIHALGTPNWAGNLVNLALKRKQNSKIVIKTS
jgi:cobyrinic acid a,c-diamide synthase